MAGGRSAQKYLQGLRETSDDALLPYRVFREGKDAVQDNIRTGRPHVENNTVQLLASLLDVQLRVS